MRRYALGWGLALGWTATAAAVRALVYLPPAETSYFVGFVAACLYLWAVHR